MGSDGLILQALASSVCGDQNNHIIQAKTPNMSNILELRALRILLTSKKFVFMCKSTSSPSIDPYSLQHKRRRGAEVRCTGPFLCQVRENREEKRPDRDCRLRIRSPDGLHVSVQLGVTIRVSGPALLQRQTPTHSSYGENSSAPQDAEGLNQSHIQSSG